MTGEAPTLAGRCLPEALAQPSALSPCGGDAARGRSAGPAADGRDLRGRIAGAAQVEVAHRRQPVQPFSARPEVGMVEDVEEHVLGQVPVRQQASRPLAESGAFGGGPLSVQGSTRRRATSAGREPTPPRELGEGVMHVVRDPVTGLLPRGAQERVEPALVEREPVHHRPPLARQPAHARARWRVRDPVRHRARRPPSAPRTRRSRPPLLGIGRRVLEEDAGSGDRIALRDRASHLPVG